MAENALEKSRIHKNIFRPSTFSRRQALERMGVTLGTGVMAALTFMSACKQTGKTTAPVTPATSSTLPPSTNTMISVPTTTTKVLTTSTPTASATTTPTTKLTTSKPTATGTTGFNYLPPITPPPLVDVPDSDCKVATDRSYSIEHVWVMPIAADIAILGITTTMVAILGEPFRMTFPAVGQSFARDDGFCEIEGYKVSADLITPVSGTVIQINTFLKAFSGQHIMEPLINDTYNNGWMIALRLGKPQELSDLLTWQDYMERLGKA